MKIDAPDAHSVFDAAETCLHIAHILAQYRCPARQPVLHGVIVMATADTRRAEKMESATEGGANERPKKM